MNQNLRPPQFPEVYRLFEDVLLTSKLTRVNGTFSQFKHFIYFLCSSMNKIWLYVTCKNMDIFKALSVFFLFLPDAILVF